MIAKLLHAWLLAAALILGGVGVAAAAPMPKVAPPDFSKIKPADFSDAELDMPYLLAHLHTVANAIVEQGERRGLFTLPVWRNEKDVRFYNARIMENHLALAWFYCTRRPWNVYYADPALRARLEAVLEYWCGMQHQDGRFSEYSDGGWNLPATAFATKFMGETLHLLKDGPPIDAALHARVIEADRRAIMAVLTREDMLAHGRNFANQYSNVWSGALAYLALYPDAEMERLLRARVAEHDQHFQSPVGYFYEMQGCDWSYNLGTEHTNHESALHFSADPALDEVFAGQMRLFYEWLSYNAVFDGTGFVLNRAIETRQRRPYLHRNPTGLYSMTAVPVAEVELARAFATSREEMEQRRREARASYEKEWPGVGPLRDFTPYHFLARSYERPLPTGQERQAAMAKLPWLARDRFVHQRVDSRHPIQYHFVRRPTYYAAFNSGKVLRSQQRYGLGLLWHPAMGAVLQSQTGSKDEAWGTLAEGAEQVFEAKDVKAALTVAGQPVVPEAGNRDLAEGELAIEYPLGEGGRKRVVFEDDGIVVEISCPGAFTENLPLLARGTGELKLEGQEATLGSLRVSFSEGAEARIAPTRTRVGAKTLQVLQLSGRDTLRYRLGFN